MGRRTFTLGQKVRAIAIVLVLIAVVVTGVVFAVNKIAVKGDTEGDTPSVQGRLDKLGEDDEEEKDDLRVFFSDEYKENTYGIRKKQNIPVSMFPENHTEREYLSGGNKEAVSIPLAMDQQRIDTMRRSMSGTTLYDALNELYKENREELEALPLAEQRDYMLDKMATELLNAAYGHAWVQAFRESWPEVIEQNPLLADFEEHVKEAMKRKPEDGKPVGWSSCMMYEDARAKEAKDHSRMVMCDKTDEEAGTYNYYDVYCLLNEIFKQLLSYEGIQSLESTDNWCLPLTVDFETMMTKKSDEQENLPAAIWAHRTKMGTIKAKFGVNVTDRRPETYEKKETPKPEDPKPKDNPDPGDTPKPDPDPDPKKYAATLIHYDVDTNATLGTDNLGNYEVGATVTGKARTFAGYTAVTSSVSDTMKEGGLTLRIGYKAKHDGDGDKDPEADPENKPGYDPGIGDNNPSDGSGDQKDDDPTNNAEDKVNGPTKKPEENRNDDGEDKTKPQTPPITDDSHDAVGKDEDGNDVNAGKETVDTVIVDDDPVEGAAAPAAVQAAEPVKAAETIEEPAQEEPKVADTTENAESSTSEEDGAGEFQEECP